MPLSTKPIRRLSPLLIWIALLSKPMLAAGVIEIESVDLPRAIQGLVYSADIRTSVDGHCPSGNVGLFLAAGSLPRGLRITEAGLAGGNGHLSILDWRPQYVRIRQSGI